jgi:hypothetical protein
MKKRLPYVRPHVIWMSCLLHTSFDPDRVPDIGSGRLQGMMKAAAKPNVSSFRSPDPSLEPQDETLYFRGS